MITVEMNVYGWIQWDFWGLAFHSNLKFPCMSKKPHLFNDFPGWVNQINQELPNFSQNSTLK